MGNVDEQIQQVEVSIEAATKQVELSKALSELTRNRNFKKVITEGYFESEAQRLVMLKADPALQDAVSQKQIDDSIMAIGNLRQYFLTIGHLGRQAAQAIEEDRETLDELHAEAA